MIDQGFVLHAYFDRQDITFELYGPKPIGHEKEHADAYDGSGLSGKLDAETLRGAISLLEDGQSPRQFVQGRAEECSVVED